MSEFKDIVWSEKVEGREKPIYHKVGVLMIHSDGKMAVKLSAVPVGPGFNGWLNVFSQKKKSEGLEPF